MSALKKKDISNPVIHIVEEVTRTKTEVADSGDSKLSELLKEAQRLEPSVVVVQGEHLGQVYRLKRGKNNLGRHPDCDITIGQRAVSGVHAEFRVTEEGEVTLEDKNSTNGTILNQQKIDRPVILRPNDLIKIGSQVLKFLDKELETRLLETLNDQGRKDSLTGIYNKGHLMQALRSSMDVSKSGYPLSVILMDIDHFKKINDTYGHLSGDYVLKEMCRVLKETVVRADDVLGRFGGEEFMLILPDSPLKVALSVAERLRQTIEKHDFVYEDKRIAVTSSFGVAEWKESYKLPEELVAVCDRFLYLSKSRGRNCVSSTEQD